MRRPEIVADAAYAIFTRGADAGTGQFLIDEDVLRDAGVTDLSGYAMKPGTLLLPHLFLGEHNPHRT